MAGQEGSYHHLRTIVDATTPEGRLEGWRGTSRRMAASGRRRKAFVELDKVRQSPIKSDEVG